jgi:hypothetical protein
MSDYHQYMTALAIQKLAAWAFAVGERPRLAEDELLRRPNRGSLPDIDFDNAVPDPNHRPLLSRIAGFLWGGLRRSTEEASAKVELRAELTAALGERLAAAYLGEDRAGDAPIRASGDDSVQNDQSRAA